MNRFFSFSAFTFALLLGTGWGMVACAPDHSERQFLAADTLLVNDSVALFFDPVEATRKTYRIDTLFQSMHRRGFNGAVLMAQHGHILYQKAFGYADFGKKTPLTTRTAFQLASVSKQFTAMAVMMLKQRGKLSYEDSVQRFYPAFPYAGITVRQLLTHRSGLPNYTYFCDQYVTDRRAHLTNQEVIRLLTLHKPAPYYLPGTHFDYSNTGYCLLAAIVEKVAGVPFGDFLGANIFKPLGMSRTLVYDQAGPVIPDRAAGYSAGRRKYDDTYLNGVVGDKGVYSTVEDLFRWELSLYTEKLVRKEVLEEAFTPAHQEPREKNYGFGWRIHTPPGGQPLVFHGGWWQGFNAYVMHGRQDHSTIILLSNVTNGSLHSVQALEEILRNPHSPLDGQR